MMQGTDRDDEHLNIFLEFVPGGSIASLLNKFGAPCIQSSLLHLVKAYVRILTKHRKSAERSCSGKVEPLFRAVRCVMLA